MQYHTNHEQSFDEALVAGDAFVESRELGISDPIDTLRFITHSIRLAELAHQYSGTDAAEELPSEPTAETVHETEKPEPAVGEHLMVRLRAIAAEINFNEAQAEAERREAARQARLLKHGNALLDKLRKIAAEINAQAAVEAAMAAEPAEPTESAESAEPTVVPTPESPEQHSAAEEASVLTYGSESTLPVPAEVDATVQDSAEPRIEVNPIDVSRFFESEGLVRATVVERAIAAAYDVSPEEARELVAANIRAGSVFTPQTRVKGMRMYSLTPVELSGKPKNAVQAEKAKPFEFTDDTRAQAFAIIDELTNMGAAHMRGMRINTLQQKLFPESEVKAVRKVVRELEKRDILSLSGTKLSRGLKLKGEVAFMNPQQIRRMKFASEEVKALLQNEER